MNIVLKQDVILDFIFLFQSRLFPIFDFSDFFHFFFENDSEKLQWQHMYETKTFLLQRSNQKPFESMN